MKQKITVVFDLDGTLVDSAPDLLNSLNYALAKESYPPVSTSRLKEYIGQGGRVMIERALLRQNKTPKQNLRERLFSYFMQYYRKTIPGDTRYFDGVTDALDRLEKHGYLLAICTNKSQDLAESLLDALDKPHRYQAICGGDYFRWSKPDPRHLISTIEEAGGNPDYAVMVGDSAADILAAQAANIPVIAVNFGYTNQPIETLDPTKIISHFDEITPKLIDDLVYKDKK